MLETSLYKCRIVNLVNVARLLKTLEDTRFLSLTLGEILRYMMLLEHVSNIYIYIVKTLNRPIKWIGRYFNLRGKVSNKVEQSKIFFDSLRTIIRDQAKMVKDRINLLSGHPSTGYPVVAVIKTVAMLFVIILAVQGVFHSPYYFCGLYGYFVVGTNPQELTEEASLQELPQKERTCRIFAVFNSLGQLRNLKVGRKEGC